MGLLISHVCPRLRFAVLPFRQKPVTPLKYAFRQTLWHLNLTIHQVPVNSPANNHEIGREL